MLDRIFTIAKSAGDVILDIYDRDYSAVEKKDKSPLTEADLAAHQLIVQELSHLTPDIPILSEESGDIPWEDRRQWRRYWLVDPLDGTKEFIRRNGEFTVNIALIENHQPVLGVVYAPVLKVGYVADKAGAFRIQNGAPVEKLEVSKPAPEEKYVVVASRSHRTAQTQAFIHQLGDVELVSMGSSLKLCLIAEGVAHIYPRFGLTSEWDTAAAQCIVENAGGMVVTTEGKPLRYNTKESLLNPYFIVSAGAFSEC